MVDLRILALIGDLKDIILSLIVWEPDIIMPNLPLMSNWRNASLNKDIWEAAKKRKNIFWRILDFEGPDPDF